MDVGLGALGLVDGVDGRGGEDDDGYVLRYCRFAVLGVEGGGVRVGEGVVVCVGVVGGEGRVVGI